MEEDLIVEDEIDDNLSDDDVPSVLLPKNGNSANESLEAVSDEITDKVFNWFWASFYWDMLHNISKINFPTMVCKWRMKSSLRTTKEMRTIDVQASKTWDRKTRCQSSTPWRKSK